MCTPDGRAHRARGARVEAMIHIAALVGPYFPFHAYRRVNHDGALNVIAACRKYDLLVSCHVPLARGAVVEDPVLQEIAISHDKTAAQIALKWLIQQPDIVVVPRALALSQIQENIDLFDFELSPTEMSQISSLRDRNLRIVDPSVRRPVWDEG